MSKPARGRRGAATMTANDRQDLVRIAVIADIHGNLTALEAVLADLAGVGVDRVVCLGDVAAIGPQPHEVAVRLRELGRPPRAAVARR